MRLAAQHSARIAEEARGLFGPEVQMRLFGSRTDDNARGGDVDLLITVPEPLERPALLAARPGARLQLALGDQRIDIVLEAPNLQRLPIHRIAHEQGVLL